MNESISLNFRLKINIMDYFLLILSILLMIVGFFGCFLPIVPGPPLNFIGLLLIHFSSFAELEVSTLFILGAITIVVQVLDYLVPAWGTKKFGGSKYGSWGSIIGLIIGTFCFSIGSLGIVGIIGRPFLGAFIGEIVGGKNNKIALKAAFGSFIGFLAGTIMKLALSITMIVLLIRELIK
jgi:uncharacterized protein